ncbi:hypothetical protein WR25_01386 [Diploscapter pachys]|uniref:Uncharacterized protein n=1 Tax=Diploscapter pachys TaxID=2018661 RepID=A0A2A2LM30_9BILA|nr:hypothetical protein WR25_01386 [Diploscapter pachys]
MPKQELELRDYLGAVAAWCVFFAFLFVFSITILNFCCVSKKDDVTVLEEWGHRKKLKMRLGPHRPSVIARAAYQREFKEDEHNKK